MNVDDQRWFNVDVFAGQFLLPLALLDVHKIGEIGGIEGVVNFPYLIFEFRQK